MNKIFWLRVLGYAGVVLVGFLLYSSIVYVPAGDPLKGRRVENSFVTGKVYQQCTEMKTCYVTVTHVFKGGKVIKTWYDIHDKESSVNVREIIQALRRDEGNQVLNHGWHLKQPVSLEIHETDSENFRDTIL